MGGDRADEFWPPGGWGYKISCPSTAPSSGCGAAVERKSRLVCNLVEADSSLSYTLRKSCTKVEAAMSSDDKIWADETRQPRSLKQQVGGLLLAWRGVIARDHLPEPRKSTATIRSGRLVFTAGEIDRLYQKTIPTWLCSRARNTATPYWTQLPRRLPGENARRWVSWRSDRVSNATNGFPIRIAAEDF
jgi:hypothetical protein